MTEMNAYKMFANSRKDRVNVCLKVETLPLVDGIVVADASLHASQVVQNGKHIQHFAQSHKERDGYKILTHFLVAKFPHFDTQSVNCSILQIRRQSKAE